MEDPNKVWLDRKIKEYNENKEQCLRDMLFDSNNVMEQYLNNPNSVATYHLLKSCMNRNKEFLEKLHLQDLILHQINKIKKTL